MCPPVDLRGAACLQELGRTLDRRWRGRDYLQGAFPELATAVLEEARLAGRIAFDELIVWALETDPLPPQFDMEARFGQPPLTVYKNDRFSVDVLFWFDGTTSIHEHNFCGAFAVLAGTSLHTRFDFELERRFTRRVRVGSLRPLVYEELAPGDVRTIHVGADLIHSVFHLETPTISLVIRTREELDPQLLQHSYYRSGLALHPFHEPVTRTRQLQLLGSLARRGLERLLPALKGYLADADLGTRVVTLMTIDRQLGDPDACAELLEELGLDPLLQKTLAATLAERRQEKYLISRRRYLKDADQRHLLALLLNVPSRRPIFELLAARYAPESPQAAAVRLLREVGKRVGKKRSRTRSERGLEGSLKPVDYWVLEQMLDGCSLKQVLARVPAGPAELHLDPAAVEDALLDLEELPALQPLLRE